jgi:hypothetical protein
MVHFHEYIRKHGKNTPTNAIETPFQFAKQTKLAPFEYLVGHPQLNRQFGNFMGGDHQGRERWMDTSFFPVQERLIDGFQASPDAVFLVDVGGGFGHDLEEFRRKIPNIPGRLVLQDLPAVIDQIQELDESIERTSHDFMTEQPIKGKRSIRT